MDRPYQSSIQNLYKDIFNVKIFIRLLFILVYFSFLSLFVGLAFWLIFTGIYWCFFKLAAYWEPAYRFLAILIGAREIDKVFKPIHLSWYSIPFECLSIGVRLLMVGYGFWLLFHLGFYQQNLIYMIFFHH